MARVFSRGNEFVSVYRAILREGKKFWEDRTRTFIIHHVRKRFRDDFSEDNIEFLIRNLRKAKQYLHGLERANNNDHKAIMRELELAYGRRGVVRHWLLRPFLNYDPSKRPSALIPSRPQSRPPPLLSPPMAAILSYHKKQLEPTLPVPQYKPLPRSREVNIRHRYRRKLLDTVEAPLPEMLMRELEVQAGGDVNTIEVVGWDLYKKYDKDGKVTYPEELKHLMMPSQNLIPISRVRRVENPLSERKRMRYYIELLKNIPILNPYPSSAGMVLDDTLKYTVIISEYARGLMSDVMERDLEGLEEEIEKRNRKNSKKR